MITDITKLRNIQINMQRNTDIKASHKAGAEGLNKQTKRREARNKVNIVDRQYFPTPTNGMTRKLQSKTNRI